MPCQMPPKVLVRGFTLRRRAFSWQRSMASCTWTRISSTSPAVITPASISCLA